MFCDARQATLTLLFIDAGVIALTAFISPFMSDRFLAPALLLSEICGIGVGVELPGGVYIGMHASVAVADGGREDIGWCSNRNGICIMNCLKNLSLDDDIACTKSFTA
jgi:hypothetical protein